MHTRKVRSGRTRGARSGQVLPIVALMMVAIIGIAAFAIDGSNLYAQHRRMQADLDVAVKVAAAKLGQNPTASVATLAITTASQLLAQDGYPSSMTITTTAGRTCGYDASLRLCTSPESTSAFHDQSGFLEGTLNQSVQGFFSGVLGPNSRRFRLSAHAVAGAGGTSQPFAILALDNNPNDCGIQVQDAGGSGITLQTSPGSVHSDSQTCMNNNGTAVISGTSESSYATNTGCGGNCHGQAITGTVGTTNGGAGYVANPYTAVLPGADPPTQQAITICASGCTLTSFNGLAGVSNYYTGPGGIAQCISNYQSEIPNLQLTPSAASNVTYYLPPDNAGSPALVSMSTNYGFKTSGGETDFLPHCDSTSAAQASPGIYYFSGTTADISTQGNGVTINSYNSAFVLSNSASKLIEQQGNGTVNWVLNQATSGPYQGIAIYEDTPCTPTVSATLNGGASSHINGVVDLSCAAVTVSGNQNDPNFINGVLVGWQDIFAGGSSTNITYDPNAAPANRGSVLVE